MSGSWAGFYRGLTVVLLGVSLVSCRDYFNRVYHYEEQIPLNPFVMKVSRTEYRDAGGNAEIRVTLQILNKTPTTASLSKKRFILRVDDTQIQHTPDLRETMGAESISFSSGEEAGVTVVFDLPKENISKSLDLIVDQSEKKDSNVLTLVHIKNSGKGMPAITTDWKQTQQPDWN